MDQNSKPQIRRLSLEHWFINYQLQAIQKSHMHLPGSIDIDVTAALSSLQTEKPQSYLTAMVIKAVALVLEQQPELNCLCASSLFGPRMIYPNYIAVNVPIRVRDGDKSVLAAHISKEPHTKTVSELRSELRDACARGLADKPIASFVARKPNTLLNRCLLRALHFVAYRLPHLYVRRGGGGASVSSLIYEGRDAAPMTTVAYGPTAFTVVLTSVWTEKSVKSEAARTLLRVGVGFDHLVGSGELAVVFAKRLAATLNGEDPALHERLLDLNREALKHRSFAASPSMPS